MESLKDNIQLWYDIIRNLELFLVLLCSLMRQPNIGLLSQLTCVDIIYISTISLIWCPDTNSKLCWFVGFCATFRTIEYVKGCESFNDLHATDNMHTPKCATKVGFLMDQLVMMIWIKLSFGNNISINQTLLNIRLWPPFIIVHYVLSVLYYYYSYCYFELLTLLGLKNSCCKEDSSDLS